MPLFSKKLVPTEITSNIEKATNASVTELDWALVFQICDAVNSTDLGAKEARKLLQKKMMASDPKMQVLGLEILNSLSENCTAKFRPQLAAKSFGEDLYALASSKTTDDRVHGKLVQCLESWASQTAGDPQFGAVRRAYDVLVNCGAANNQRGQSRNHQQKPREAARPVDVNADIELAKNSAQLFSQTLSFTDPTKEDILKNTLIQEFYAKCKQAQQIIASHLTTNEDSDVISALINANNELLSCFKSYDEMLEQHAVNEATMNSQALNSRSTCANEQQQQTEELLIPSSSSAQPPMVNAHTTPPTTNTNNPYQIYSNTNDDPFDPFADTNQVSPSNNTSNDTAVNTAGAVLPAPLTPQKLHE